MVNQSGDGHIEAHCPPEGVLTRCAIWISVSVRTEADRVTIRQHPGSSATGVTQAPNVTIEPVP